MLFVDPAHIDPWRPSAITEHAYLRLGETAIEEFMVDPLVLIEDWFDKFTLVKHTLIEHKLNPNEALTKGYVPRGDVLLPVQFQAILPPKSTILASRLRKKEAQGKLHGWFFKEVFI